MIQKWQDLAFKLESPENDGTFTIKDLKEMKANLLRVREEKCKEISSNVLSDSDKIKKLNKQKTETDNMLHVITTIFKSFIV